MTITIYGSFEDMMADLGKAMKAADSQVNPTQSKVKPGDYLLNFRYGPDLPIFGEVLECDDPIYKEPHMKNYRFTKCYSQACECGEYGDVHISEVDAVLDPLLFSWYAKHGWRKPERD